MTISFAAGGGDSFVDFCFVGFEELSVDVEYKPISKPDFIAVVCVCFGNKLCNVGTSMTTRVVAAAFDDDDDDLDVSLRKSNMIFGCFCVRWCGLLLFLGVEKPF